MITVKDNNTTESYSGTYKYFKEWMMLSKNWHGNTGEKQIRTLLDLIQQSLDIVSWTLFY